MNGLTKPRGTDVGGPRAHPILIPGSAQRASKSNEQFADIAASRLAGANHHVDHVLTEAENRAARRAIDAAYNDEPRIPFHQMVREEQRKMLQVVRDDETRTT